MNYQDMREGQLMVLAGQGDKRAQYVLDERRRLRREDFEDWKARTGRSAVMWGA
jgi:predicted nucleic acid-binding OB-fold protein